MFEINWDFYTAFLFLNWSLMLVMGFSGGSDDKESTCSAEDLSLIPGLGRSPGEGNGHLLRYSCQNNPMDRGACQAPWCRKELDMTERLN